MTNENPIVTEIARSPEMENVRQKLSQNLKERYSHQTHTVPPDDLVEWCTKQATDHVVGYLASRGTSQIPRNIDNALRLGMDKAFEIESQNPSHILKTPEYRMMDENWKRAFLEGYFAQSLYLGSEKASQAIDALGVLAELAHVPDTGKVRHVLDHYGPKLNSAMNNPKFRPFMEGQVQFNTPGTNISFGPQWSAVNTLRRSKVFFDEGNRMFVHEP